MGRNHRGQPGPGSAIRETPSYPGGLSSCLGPRSIPPMLPYAPTWPGRLLLWSGQALGHGPGRHLGPAADVQFGHHMMEMDLGGRAQVAAWAVTQRLSAPE